MKKYRLILAPSQSCENENAKLVSGTWNDGVVADIVETEEADNILACYESWSSNIELFSYLGNEKAVAQCKSMADILLDHICDNFELYGAI